jgi:ABC-2 type transport system permease protein
MFWHNFKYTLKIVLRDHALIFWTFAFPLILATFFFLAFSNITSSESLDIINLAVVNNEAWKDDQIFRAALQELSDESSDDQLFNTKYVSRAEAEQLLESDEIAAYLLLEESAQNTQSPASPQIPTIFTSKSNIDSTIVQSVVESIAEQASIITTVLQENPAALKDLAKAEKANIVDQSSSNLDYVMIEYYTLIAMICLYGGIIGMVAVNQLLADMSMSGRRIAISPARKSTLVFAALCASYLIQLVAVALLFLFLIFVLHVDFGTHLPLIILLALIGSLAGLALGVLLATTIKSTANTKVGLILAITMFGCFLAGMMGITMKYLVDTNLPLLNRLNPANLITDGLYSLYYYDTFDRYWGNIITLVIISLVMISISVYSLRKEQHDRL